MVRAVSYELNQLLRALLEERLSKVSYMDKCYQLHPINFHVCPLHQQISEIGFANPTQDCILEPVDENALVF